MVSRGSAGSGWIEAGGLHVPGGLLLVVDEASAEFLRRRAWPGDVSPDARLDPDDVLPSGSCRVRVPPGRWSPVTSARIHAGDDPVPWALPPGCRPLLGLRKA